MSTIPQWYGIIRFMHIKMHAHMHLECIEIRVYTCSVNAGVSSADTSEKYFQIMPMVGVAHPAHAHAHAHAPY